MARLRYNGLKSTLGAELGAASTSITFAAPLTHVGGAVPTLAGSDYLALSITGSSGLAEVVYLTAYTSGNATGTVLRAQEGSTAAVRAAGSKVFNAMTVADVGIMLDPADTPLDGQALVYDSTSGTWKAEPVEVTINHTGEWESKSVTFTHPADKTFDLVGATRSIPGGSAIPASPQITYTVTQADYDAFSCSDPTVAFTRAFIVDAWCRNTTGTGFGTLSAEVRRNGQLLSTGSDAGHIQTDLSTVNVSLPGAVVGDVLDIRLYSSGTTAGELIWYGIQPLIGSVGTGTPIEGGLWLVSDVQVTLVRPVPSYSYPASNPTATSDVSSFGLIGGIDYKDVLAFSASSNPTTLQSTVYAQDGVIISPTKGMGTTAARTPLISANDTTTYSVIRSFSPAAMNFKRLRVPVPPV